MSAAGNDTTAIKPASTDSTTVFSGSDFTTRGGWKGAYGSNGYGITYDSSNYPSYAQVAFTGQNLVQWAPSTSDARAPQKTAANDRIASAWWTGSSFNIDVSISDGNIHQIALYCLDWDGNNARIQRVDVLDAGTGNILDTRTLSSFSNGIYLIWNVSGHVVFRTTALAVNAVVSGIFFGGPPTGSTAMAGFIRSDSTTQGSWKAEYGSNGHGITYDSASYPSYAQVTFTGQNLVQWAPSTPDSRAPQKTAATDRIASAWWTGSSFNIDVSISDGNIHQIALYCLDWDGNNARIQRVDVLDAGTGNILDTQTLSSFSNGIYLIWNVSGHVVFRTTALAVNAVVSGIFFGGPPTGSTAVAAFIKSDSTTQGSWKADYGSNGHGITYDSANYPSYAQVTFTGQNLVQWAPSTSDSRAPQKTGATDRIASAWWTGSSFNIDVSISDGNIHQIALYCLDWDGNNARSQRVDVLDAGTGNILDTQTLSRFSNGIYLIWNVRGHVIIRTTALAVNAVVSGIFFGGAPTDSKAIAGFIKSDSTAHWLLKATGEPTLSASPR